MIPFSGGDSGHNVVTVMWVGHANKIMKKVKMKNGRREIK
jgi:hypothetical protein